MGDDECIFCKINAGEIPSYTLFEDDLVRVLMDVNPVSRGHLLVIPKIHCVDVCDCPDEVLERINVVCKKFGRVCCEKLGASGFNIVNASGADAQQVIFHLHYHIIPRYPNDKLDLWFHGKHDSSIDVESVFESLK